MFGIKSELDFSRSKYSIREDRSAYKVYMWLVIRLFSQADIGTYNCVSTNSLGRAEGTLRLYGTLGDSAIQRRVRFIINKDYYLTILTNTNLNHRRAKPEKIEVRKLSITTPSVPHAYSSN
ncbi:hypothetical protein ABEB36_007760 [Hypothenemus hampei]|uniref:Immunoglobulin I-set domain-containing protein n=1 Tax=Hypothenemus hampei TaxID=57062 RepID=A0ABD1EW36_HYPHA